MKEKNIKINHKALVKLATFAAVGTVTIGSLTGCQGKNRSILHDTPLNNSYVITFENGTKDIALAKGISGSSSYFVYESIISENRYTKIYDKSERTPLCHTAGGEQEMPIVSVEPISVYLTSEDIQKGINNTLSNEDIIAIIERINLQGNNEAKDATLSLTNN